QGCHTVDKDLGFTTENKVFMESVKMGRLLIALCDNTLCGYLYYGFLWNYEVANIQMIRILSDFRRKGIGSQLISYLENDLKNENVPILLSSTDGTNKNSYKFHKSMNFIECG